MEFVGLLPLVGIALLFWLLVIRPASRRQRDQLRMQSALAIGDEVILTSGVIGIVRTLTESRLGLEVAPGVVITVARGAVGGVVPPEESVGSPVEQASTTDRPIAAEES